MLCVEVAPLGYRFGIARSPLPYALFVHALFINLQLKPSNVLLRAAPHDPRGFTCKLSDFG